MWCYNYESRPRKIECEDCRAITAWCCQNKDSRRLCSLLRPPIAAVAGSWRRGSGWWVRCSLWVLLVGFVPTVGIACVAGSERVIRQPYTLRPRWGRRLINYCRRRRGPRRFTWCINWHRFLHHLKDPRYCASMTTWRSGSFQLSRQSSIGDRVTQSDKDILRAPSKSDPKGLLCVEY